MDWKEWVSARIPDPNHAVSRNPLVLFLEDILVAVEEYEPAEDEAVNSVTVTGDTEVFEGDTIQLTAVVDATGGASEDVTWSSDDDNVAIVDSSGVVTGVAAGVATITATSVADSQVSGSLTVEVKEQQ